jgi:hypothetical protein
MANKTIRYESGSLMIEKEPYSITDTSTLRLNVRTKGGSFHTLLISGVNVHEAKCVRSTVNRLCAKFKGLAAQMYHQL